MPELAALRNPRSALRPPLHHLLRLSFYYPFERNGTTEKRKNLPSQFHVRENCNHSSYHYRS